MRKYADNGEEISCSIRKNQTKAATRKTLFPHNHHLVCSAPRETETACRRLPTVCPRARSEDGVAGQDTPVAPAAPPGFWCRAATWSLRRGAHNCTREKLLLLRSFMRSCCWSGRDFWRELLIFWRAVVPLRAHSQ